MKRIKNIIGFMLIITALAGIIFWETIGREASIYKEVIVAASDIQEGSIITNSMT